MTPTSHPACSTSPSTCRATPRRAGCATGSSPRLDDLARYPTAAADARARDAVAARHGRRPDEVLVLAGSAEGFALLPALRPRLAAVVHPGFTEPEAALRAAGVPVVRVLTAAADGHRLRPDDVPADADLVVVGNPTNPTAVLHPAAALRALGRPGRVVVVDEAFADALPGEPESVAGADSRACSCSAASPRPGRWPGCVPATPSATPTLLARLAAPAAAVAGLDPRAGGGRRVLRARGRRRGRPRRRGAGRSAGRAGRGARGAFPG